MNNTWILIPARGGSKGIPRKNLRFLGGKPLILHVLDEMNAIFKRDQIIVSTDSKEIATIAESLAIIHMRTQYDASDTATLDQVAVSVCHWLLHQGADESDYLFTVQATSPLIKNLTLSRGVESLKKGAGSVITVQDDRHLRWTIDQQTGNPKPLFAERVNRQWLPLTYAETGGMIGARISDICKHKTRIIEPVELVEVDNKEGLDIDDFTDWAVAEYLLTRKKIIIRADASPSLGMGHIYRAQALAHEFSDHEIIIISRSDNEFSLGAQFISMLSYKTAFIRDDTQFIDYLKQEHADIVIVDILDTDVDFIRQVKSHTEFVVSFEDLGPGGQFADIVINDLYTDFLPQQNHWYGVKNSILGSAFEMTHPRDSIRKTVNEILVTFGGSDPQNLTLKTLHALQSLKFLGKVTIILGPGYCHALPDVNSFQLNATLLRSVKNMALLMREADIAVTSAGRTVAELMCLGVPTIVLCQNLRELRHTHASSPFGVINLGLGEHVNTEAIASHIKLLVDNYTIRIDMSNRALQAISGRSNREICSRIIKAANANLPTSHHDAVLSGNSK